MQEPNPEDKTHSEQEPEQDLASSGLGGFLREWRGFFIFVVLMVVFRSIIGDWNHVPSGSMRPTLLVGDRVVVNKIAFDLRVPFTFIRLLQHNDPDRGDIITFESPKGGKLLIKRVVGVPGDRVELRDNSLWLNGVEASYRPLNHTEIDALQLPDADEFGIFIETSMGHSRIMMREHLRVRPRNRSFRAVNVPAGKYLVLGDNRDNSGDYREVGLVDRKSILGRAHSVAFSLDYDNYYIPRSGRRLQSLSIPQDSTGE